MPDNSTAYPLAGFFRRVAAYLIDVGLFFLPLIVFGLIWLILAATSIEPCDPSGVEGCREIRVELSVMFVALGLAVVTFVWWLAAIGRGQTPGKMLLGIRVLKKNGEPSGWGYTFLREMAVKGLPFLLAMLLANSITLSLMFGMTWFARSEIWSAMILVLLAVVGAGMLVDGQWAPRDENGQSLHDKVFGTVVVRIRP